MERGMDSHKVRQTQQDINSRIYVVGTWLSSVKFYQVPCVLEIFQNKILQKINKFQSIKYLNIE